MNRLLVACFIGMVVMGSVPRHGAAVEIFEYPLTKISETRTIRSGFTRMELNRSILAIEIGGLLQLTMPDGSSYQVIIDRRKVHRNQDVSIVGYLQQYGKSYRMIVTSGEHGLYGRFRTPLGEFLIQTDDNGTWLVNPEEGNMQVAPPSDDMQIPPSSKLGEPVVDRLAAAGAEAGSPSANSIVDVMVLYTANVDNPETRINQLVTLANTAYVDSGVYITLNLVHTEYIDYPEQTSNLTTLDDLSDGISPFHEVAALRDQYGADLVSLLRPYYKDSQDGCGYAWIGGYEGQPFYSSYGFSVVSDGSDGGGSGYYCRDTTFVHELGHNMGSMHDRAHTNDEGAYSYSYGYGVEDDFGTIMSYINPVIPLFSNPDLEECGDSNVPCGIIYTAPNSADNRLSLNNSGDSVAAYKPRVIFASGDLNGDLQVDLEDAVIGLQVTSGGEVSNALFTAAALDGSVVRVADVIAILKLLAN